MGEFGRGGAEVGPPKEGVKVIVPPQKQKGEQRLSPAGIAAMQGLAFDEGDTPVEEEKAETGTVEAQVHKPVAPLTQAGIRVMQGLKSDDKR